jgi:hypothetical protein
MLRNAWPMAALSCLFFIGGCSDNDDGRYGPGPDRPLVTGTLELRWTIEGSSEAEACEAIGAIDFETVISDGFAVSELEADCAEFSAPMTLYVGDYVARSRLVDANDTTITHRVVLDRVRVLQDEVTVVRIDFPSEFVVLPGEDEAGEDAGLPPVVEPDAEAPPPEDEVVDAGGVSDAAPPEEPADAAAP